MGPLQIVFHLGELSLQLSLLLELFFRCLNGLLGLLQFALSFNEACFRSR